MAGDNPLMDAVTDNTDCPDENKTKGDLATGVELPKPEHDVTMDDGDGDKYTLDDVISAIIMENTTDFKDFQYPKPETEMLYYRMHHEINRRLKAMRLDLTMMKLNDVLAVYRNRYCKVDDIKFITKTFSAIQLHNNPAAPPLVVPMPIPATAVRPSIPIELANPGAHQEALTSTPRVFLSAMFEPIGAQAAGLVPSERVQMKRQSSLKRVVRFKSPPVRESRKDDDIKEEEK